MIYSEVFPQGIFAVEREKGIRKKEKKIQRNPAIAHFKGPTDFMPYCGNALLPYDYILKKKAQRPMMRPHEFWGISCYKRCEDAMENLIIDFTVLTKA